MLSHPILFQFIQKKIHSSLDPLRQPVNLLYCRKRLIHDGIYMFIQPEIPVQTINQILIQRSDLRMMKNFMNGSI